MKNNKTPFDNQGFLIQEEQHENLSIKLKIYEKLTTSIFLTLLIIISTTNYQSNYSFFQLKIK